MTTNNSVTATEARARVNSGKSLLVCGYDSDQKFHNAQLERAISLSAFKSQLSDIPRDKEIIFY